MRLEIFRGKAACGNVPVGERATSIPRGRGGGFETECNVGEFLEARAL